MISIDRDSATRLASFLGIQGASGLADSEIKSAIENRITTIFAAGDGKMLQSSRFSMTVHGKDLRREIIEGIIQGMEETSDPAVMADDIMVGLGFESGYDLGDYTDGFQDYLKDVGLVKPQ